MRNYRLPSIYDMESYVGDIQDFLKSFQKHHEEYALAWIKAYIFLFPEVEYSEILQGLKQFGICVEL